MSVKPMPRAKSDSEAVNLTLPSAWLEEAEQYAEWLSEPGMRVTRADVLRRAMGIGMPEMKAKAEEARKAKKGGR